MPDVPTLNSGRDLAFLGGIVIGFLLLSGFNVLLRHFGMRAGLRLLLIGLAALGGFANYFLMDFRQYICVALAGFGVAGIVVIMLDLRRMRIDREPKKWF